MEARTVWPKRSHERAVERFYSHGVNNETEIHRGFLNFGLWEEGIDDYVAAAENLVLRIGTMLGLRPGSKLLDLACGMGSQDIYLRRTFGPLEIDAMDITWRHVERAIRRVREEGVTDGIRFRHGSATEIPFAGRTFTHVMSIEGPEHFLTRRRFFDEAFRVLASGGVMSLADYTLKRQPANALERMIFAAARSLWRIPRENVCTATEYRDQLLAAGFRDVTIEHVGELTFPGYYREQRRPAFRQEMERLQGRLVGRLGHLINVVTNRAYRMGLVDYILVRAVKPVEGAAA